MFIWFMPYGESKCPACLIGAKWHINSSYHMCSAQMRQHHAGHLGAWKDFSWIEKDYLRLEKTIYSFKKTLYCFEVISAE